MATLIKLVIVSIGLALGIGVYCNMLLQETINIPESGYYLIPRGQSFNALSNDLRTRSILDVPGPLLKLYGLLTRFQGTIKAGEYELTNNLDTKSLLLKFRQGKVIQREITFPEGWDFSLIHVIFA